MRWRNLLTHGFSTLRETRDFIPEARRHRRRLERGHQPIYLDYPVDPSTRYGWGRPSHPGLEELFSPQRASFAERIHALRAHADALRRIPLRGDRAGVEPFWLNDWMQGLDAAALYAFPSLFGSRLYVEVGSGNSTKFVRKARDEGGLPLRMVSIDPQPRADIDRLCDEVIRAPLETVDPALFDRLGPGDILVIDNSHRCFQNSDVTVAFLDVLPRLRAGVLVYIDDIYLPWDYPPAWRERYYSEQYLVAVLLLADRGRRYEVLLPGYYCTIDPELKAHADAFWKDLGLPEMTTIDSNGLWLRVR